MKDSNNLRKFKVKGHLSKNLDQNSFFREKVTLIIDSLDKSNRLSKRDFLKNIFEAAFKMIPEAEKGSFYELNGEDYIPILSKNYNVELLRKLSFKKDVAFIDFDCTSTANIEAYQIHVSERDDSRFTKEEIDIFKALGTYSNFTSLYAPIQMEGENIGLLCLENFNNKGYSSLSKKILKFYAQLISNFYAQKVLKENDTKRYDEIVHALVSAIEVKDIYTVGHAQRVKEYSTALAKELGLSEELIQDIGKAAILHDVGKIGIPTEILLKPGKLTFEEYEIIKKHPEHSKKILDGISGFSNIVNYAYYHHERYDGIGYPEGLKGSEIPFPALIIQLADAYDAMTSKRAYRDSLGKAEALKIIESESGKQFHPEIAKAAIKLYSGEYNFIE